MFSARQLKSENAELKQKSDQNEILTLIRALTSGVEGLGDLRSVTGFESTVLGDLSMEWRAFCSGEGELESDLAGPLETLLTLGVAGEVLLGMVSDNPVLISA